MWTGSSAGPTDRADPDGSDRDRRDDRADPVRVLLTGAGGFLGGVVAADLETRGHTVFGVGLTGREGWPAFDLTDPDQATRAVADAGPEVVIHLAGQSSPGAAEVEPGRAFRANIVTTWNLVEAVSSGFPGARFVLGSSAAVYGRPDPSIARRITEEDPVEPVTIYGASKAAAELIASGYGNATGSGGVRPAVLRIFNLIGSGQHHGVAADLIEAVRAGRDPGGAVRNPAAVRDFTDVRDAARAVSLVAEADAVGVFNLCSGRAVPVAELAGAVARVTGGPVSAASSDPGEHRSGKGGDTLAGDPARLREAVGWEAQTSLVESLGAMLAEGPSPGP